MHDVFVNDNDNNYFNKTTDFSGLFLKGHFFNKSFILTEDKWLLVDYCSPDLRFKRKDWTTYKDSFIGEI